MSDKPNTFETEFEESVDHGVMFDRLNLKKIIFWTILGIAVLVVMIVGVSNFYHYTKFQAQQKAAIATEFYQINSLKNAANEKLQTVGVANSDQNTFHIPIEDAITLILNEAN